MTSVYDMASRVIKREYRTKANSPSGPIADQDTFTYDAASRKQEPGEPGDTAYY
jgi:hypothetical protein